MHDSRGIEIVNFTISLALSAGTLMASAGTPYRLVPAHFYPCHGGRCWGIRWSGDGRPQLARPLPPRLLQHGAATRRRRDSGNERANNAFRAPTAHPDIPPRCGRKAEAPCGSVAWRSHGPTPFQESLAPLQSVDARSGVPEQRSARYDTEVLF